MKVNWDMVFPIGVGILIIAVAAFFCFSTTQTEIWYVEVPGVGEINEIGNSKYLDVDDMAWSGESYVISVEVSPVFKWDKGLPLEELRSVVGEEVEIRR